MVLREGPFKNWFNPPPLPSCRRCWPIADAGEMFDEGESSTLPTRLGVSSLGVCTISCAVRRVLNADTRKLSSQSWRLGI